MNPQRLDVKIEIVIDPESNDTAGVQLGSRQGLYGLSVHHESC